MEPSVYPWEVIFFGCLFYAIVTGLIVVLAAVSAFNRHSELYDSKAEMYSYIRSRTEVDGIVDDAAASKLIKKLVKRTVLPSVGAFLIWTAWLVAFLIDRHSVTMVVLFCAAMVVLFVCTALFIRSHILDWKLKQSHIGVMRS